LKTIEKPAKGGMIYRENLQISFELIKTCMPLPECIDFVKKSSKLAEGGAEIYQIQLVRAIYLNVMNSNSPPDVLKTTYLSFFSHLIQFANVMLKTADELDYNKLHALIWIAKKWTALAVNRKKLQSSGGLDFKDIRKSPAFTAFGKNCLKYGMAFEYMEGTHKLDNRSSVLLKFLAFVCETMLMDDSNAATAGQFFEWATTHSNFFEISLSQHLDNQTKRGLFYLLWTLVKKNRKIIDVKHVPLYLGAYHATISPTDRYILALIRFYEQCGANLQEYRPFLWGEAAVTHFALRNQDATNAVKQQEVNNMAVMSIIDRRIVEATIAEFPVWRRLDAVQQVPQEEFDDLQNIVGLDESYAIDLAANNVQRLVEANQSKFDQSILKLTARDDNEEAIVYDPAFFVPLMALMFAPESTPIGGLVNRNGMLSLIFSSLACKDDEMRLAAGYVLHRGQEIIENTK
jgi:nucleolar pre-ribosomal-associated protein 1